MAHKNAAELAENIPECVSGCFDNGVAATGCDDADFDCWCYDKNHQTIVDTMYQCLENKERRLKKSCSEDEMFEMENNYWKICEQYWEPYGTATQPVSAQLASSTTAVAGGSSSATTAASVTTSTSSAANTASDTSSTSSSNPSTSRLTSAVSSSSEPSSTIPTSAAETGVMGEDKEATLTANSELTSGAKAGIGIGVTVGVLLIVAMVFLLLRERKKRKYLEDEMMKLSHREKSNGYPQFYAEMPGSQPYVGELRGDTLASELSATPALVRKSESFHEIQLHQPSSGF